MCESMGEEEVTKERGTYTVLTSLAHDMKSPARLVDPCHYSVL